MAEEGMVLVEDRRLHGQRYDELVDHGETCDLRGTSVDGVVDGGRTSEGTEMGDAEVVDKERAM